MSAYFDRFDVCEAFYLWCAFNYDGMGSDEYGVLCRLRRIGFKPRPSLGDERDLTENGLEIYRALERGDLRIR